MIGNGTSKISSRWASLIMRAMGGWRWTTSSKQTDLPPPPFGMMQAWRERKRERARERERDRERAKERAVGERERERESERESGSERAGASE